MQKLLSCFSLSTLLLLPIAGIAYPFAYLPQTTGVEVVDLADSSTKTTLSVPQASATEVMPNGQKVIVAGQDNELSIYAIKYPDHARNNDSNSNDNKDSVGLSNAAVALAASPDSQYVWASLAGGTQVARIKLSDKSVVTFSVGFAPGPLLMSNDGLALYVAESNGPRVAKLSGLSAETPTLSATWTLSHPVSSLALRADGARLFVGQPAGNIVSVRNTADGSEVAQLAATAVQTVAVSGVTLYAGLAGTVKAWTISGDAITAHAADVAVSGTPVRLNTSQDGKTLYYQNNSGAWGTVPTGATSENTSATGYPLFGRFIGPYPSLLKFSQTTYEVDESVGTTTTIRVTRSGDLTSSPAFLVSTSDRPNDDTDDARVGQDYVELKDEPITFDGNSLQSSVSVPVVILNDSLYGTTEYFHVSAKETPTKNVPYRLDPATVTVGIVNDDSDPRDSRSGCSLSSGTSLFDPSLPLLALASGLVLLRRSRSK